MTPKEAQRLYVHSLYRAVFGFAPFGVMAILLGAATRFTPDSAEAIYRLFLISSVLTALAGMITFILLRRCPRCACRAPVTKRSSGRCRRCRIRLQG